MDGPKSIESNQEEESFNIQRVKGAKIVVTNVFFLRFSRYLYMHVPPCLVNKFYGNLLPCAHDPCCMLNALFVLHVYYMRIWMGFNDKIIMALFYNG